MVYWFGGTEKGNAVYIGGQHHTLHGSNSYQSIQKRWRPLGSPSLVSLSPMDEHTGRRPGFRWGRGGRERHSRLQRAVRRVDLGPLPVAARRQQVVVPARCVCQHSAVARCAGKFCGHRRAAARDGASSPCTRAAVILCGKQCISAGRFWQVAPLRSSYKSNGSLAERLDHLFKFWPLNDCRKLDVLLP
jgi:hypothetical protein